MATERIYIIGAGLIARHHVAAVSKLPGGEHMEMHVSDNNPDALQRFKREFPRITPHGDTRAMLANPAQPNDIVIVSTPPSSHCSLTLQSLESGRHVLCEKPLAMNQDESQRMLDKAREIGYLMGCCSVRYIGHSATDTMREWLDQGKLGDVYNVTWCTRNQRSREGMVVEPGAAWRVDCSQSGGGVLMDWGPYDFTVLADVLRPVRVDVLSAWVAPSVANAKLPEGRMLDVEPHVGASLLYHREDGGRVPVTYERGHPAYAPPLNSYEFQGTQGTVALDWLGTDGLTYYHDAGGEVASEHIPYEPRPNEPKMLERPLCYFHALVNGQSSPALVNEGAVFNLSCIRAIYDCAETGRPKTVIREDVS